MQFALKSIGVLLGNNKALFVNLTMTNMVIIIHIFNTDTYTWILILINNAYIVHIVLLFILCNEWIMWIANLHVAWDCSAAILKIVSFGDLLIFYDPHKSSASCYYISP